MGDDTARLPIESQLRVLPANVTVEVVQARNLPRGGILAPKAQVQVYCPFVEAPVAATEPSARNTAPSWNYTKAIKLRHHASSLPVLRFVVIDSLAPTVPLGTASLTVRAPATRGWLPLDGENSRADLFVVVRWNSCPIAYAPHLPEPPQVPDTNAVAGPELRTVDPRPGAIFRRGSFVVEVTAAGIPASVAQPWVCVRSRDQKLRGGETPDSRAWWKRKCEHIQLQSSADKTNDIQLPPAATPSASCDSVTDSLDAVDETDNTDNIAAAAAVNLEIAKVNLDIPREEDETIDPNDSSTHYAPIPPQNTSKRSAFKSRLSHARKSEHAGSLIKTVKNAKDKASTSFDTVSHIRPTRSAIGATVTAAKVRKKTIKKLRDKAVSPNSNTNASSAAGVASPPQTTPASVLQTLMAPRPRRAVDFGLFCFAEFAVEPPKCLYITVTDNDSRLPDALGAVLECELSLDILGSDGTSVVLAYCEAGPVRAKASVWVRVTRIAGYPDVCAYPAPVNVVTEKFMGLLENSEQLAADFKTTYPHAEGLTYLFVGGLFTNHYPLYFTRNVDYLQQKLLLPRVQCIPIHTESGLAANAKVIAASVAKTATRRNSVVLIGHSKGGCDILQAITHHIEIIPFMYVCTLFPYLLLYLFSHL